MKPYMSVIKQDFQSYPEHYNARALSSVIYCIAHTRISQIIHCSHNQPFIQSFFTTQQHREVFQTISKFLFSLLHRSPWLRFVYRSSYCLFILLFSTSRSYSLRHHLHRNTIVTSSLICSWDLWKCTLPTRRSRRPWILSLCLFCSGVIIMSAKWHPMYD